MAYTTEEKVENYLQIDIDDTISAYVDEWIGYVKSYIDNYTGTTFEASAESRYFDTNGQTSVQIDDLISATQIDFLDEDGNVDETLSLDDYWLYPLNSTPKNELRLNPYGGNPIFRVGSKRLKITGNWGVATTVPAEIEWLATAMTAAIIRQMTNVGKIGKSETLAEYSITYDDVGKNVTPEMLKILDKYRTPNV